jgi:hypothetical protein
MGDNLLRFGQNWWTQEVQLDLAELEHAEDADALGVLDLTNLTDVRTRNCSDGSYSSTNFMGQVFTHGSFAYLPRSTYYRGNDADGSWYSRQVMSLAIVDLSDQSRPRIVGEVEFEPTGYHGGTGEQSRYAGFVQTENALLVGRSTGDYYYYYYYPEDVDRPAPTFSYDVVDLRAGADAQVVSRVEVPSLLANGGWGYGVVGCYLDLGWGWWGGYGAGLALASGDIVASQHEEAVDDGTGRVRYYLDRIDVSDPANPQVLDPINIPGQLLRYEHDAGRLVTLDYGLVVIEAARDDYNACYEQGGNVRFEFAEGEQDRIDFNYATARGTCSRWYRRLNSLVLDDGIARRVSLLEIETDSESGLPRQAPQIAVTQSRLFFQRWIQGEESWQWVEPEIVALGYALDGRLSELGSVEPETIQTWGRLEARGERAFLSSYGALEVITSKNDQAPQATTHDLYGQGCTQGALEITGDQAYCALGMYGVQSIALN